MRFPRARSDRPAVRAGARPEHGQLISGQLASGRLASGRLASGQLASGRLAKFHTPESPQAIVLLLHGGQQRSHRPVRAHHASWWRMALMARTLVPFARRQRLVVALLRYGVRGWNDPVTPSPVTDARAAIESLRAEYPELPIVLAGHSMGGRTACRVADSAGVAGVCALAPWLPEGEPTDALPGRILSVIHGTADHWTSPRWSQNYVDRCQGVAAEASWQPLPGVGHFMLRRIGKWNEFVRDSISHILGLREQPEANAKGPR